MTILAFIGGAEIMLLLIVPLFILLLTLIALVDILKSNFEGNTKLIWVIVVIFLNIVGAILYFLIGKNQKIRDTH